MYDSMAYMAWACVYSCHQCFALVASVNSVNLMRRSRHLLLVVCLTAVWCRFRLDPSHIWSPWTLRGFCSRNSSSSSSSSSVCRRWKTTHLLTATAVLAGWSKRRRTRAGKQHRQWDLHGEHGQQPPTKTRPSARACYTRPSSSKRSRCHRINASLRFFPIYCSVRYAHLSSRFRTTIMF